MGAQFTSFYRDSFSALLNYVGGPSEPATTRDRAVGPVPGTRTEVRCFGTGRDRGRPVVTCRDAVFVHNPEATPGPWEVASGSRKTPEKHDGTGRVIDLHWGHFIRVSCATLCNYSSPMDGLGWITCRLTKRPCVHMRVDAPWWRISMAYMTRWSCVAFRHRNAPWRCPIGETAQGSQIPH